MPVLRTSFVTSELWSLSTLSSALPLVANAGRFPSASEKSWPRLVIVVASSCCQMWKAWRVPGSNARRISSSSTVGCTWPSANRAPSFKGGARLVPGVSST